jgi:hypothetical protein
MKNKAAPVDRRPKFSAASEKFLFIEPLIGFWRDLEDDQRWKYEELSPDQLLKKLKFDHCLADKDELERAEFFWSRQPRLLPLASSILWIVVALGLPLWLFIIPAIGMPLLIIWAVAVVTGIVRTVRWRRQYELSIDRLIRHPGRSEHSTASL